MIKLGIDARPITSEHLGGIGVYTKAVLHRLLSDDRFEVFCYANQPLAWFEDVVDERHFRLMSGRPSAFFYRYAWGKTIQRDNLDVFWGTAQVLPRQTVAQREVLTVHDLALLIDSSWGNSRIDYLVERFHTPRSIRRADCVICVSDSTSHDIDELVGVVKGSKHVVHLGGPVCDSAQLEQMTGKAVLEGDFFVYFGDLNERKNIKNLLRAFADVARKRACHLVIGGKGSSSDVDALVTYIGANDVRECIDVVGFVTDEEKHTLLSRSCALVFPSRYEGFGLPILEGMSAGTLVVTSRVSSLPEVAGQAAVYVDDPEDADALAEALLTCLDMPADERESRIEAGRHQASIFSWDKCAADTVGLLAGNFD